MAIPTPPAVAGPPRPSRGSQRVLLLGTGLVLVAALALGLLVWQLHRSALLQAHQTVRMLGIAVGEQTSRSMQGADVVLHDLRRQIAQQGITSEQQFKTGLANEDLFRFLRNRAEFLPQVEAIGILSADGSLVNFSRRWPIPTVAFPDRYYIRHFNEHDSPDAIISDPVQNRVTGSWTAYLARRVNAPSGQFLGVVVAAIRLDYFNDFFRKLSHELDMSVSLLHRDGTMLTSYPVPDLVGRRAPEDSPWYAIARSGADVFESGRISNFPNQIIAVQPLHDYPLVVDVGIKRSTALTEWRRTTQVIGAASLFIAVCFALLIREQLRQVRSLEESETLLATRNAALLDQADQLSRSRTETAVQSATLQTALRHMNQGIIMVTADDRVVVCNDRAMAMLELPHELVWSDASFAALVAHQAYSGEFIGPDAALWARTLQQTIDGPEIYERTRPNGTILEIQTVPMQGGGMVRTYTDVTERRRIEQQVRYLARHDELTGLYNRTSFHEQFQALIVEADRQHHHIGVFYIDLDGFKAINDTHGHAIGDELLAEVAARLRAAVRDTDVVARMGGDEFAVIQPFFGSGGNTEDLANRLLASVAEPYALGETQCGVNLSIGVALFPDHGRDAAALLHQADLALYRAKASGKGTFRLYDGAIDQDQHAAETMEQDLAKALGRHELHLAFQPIVDTDTLLVRRYEALLRWTHPLRGAVSPTDFIAVAEKSGLIAPIGLWVLETACQTACTWPPEIGLSVNLSPLQFKRGDLADQVEQILQRTSLDPARLNLEITEGVLLEDTPDVVLSMNRLKDLGVRFSLDDFGTAYAGLSYLRTFPFDVLKIDKSFVQNAGNTQVGRDLLAAIHAVASACNLQVVAEGVETEAELALMRDLRCDHVQGFLLGRPNASVA